MWDKIKPYYPLIKGAAVAALGAICSYVVHWASGSEVGSCGPVLGAIAAFALDAIHHTVATADTSDPHEPRDPHGPDDGHGSLSIAG